VDVVVPAGELEEVLDELGARALFVGIHSCRRPCLEKE
jgi:hypothetical protein